MIRLSLKVKSSASSNGFAKFGRYSRELLESGRQEDAPCPLGIKRQLSRGSGSGAKRSLAGVSGDVAYVSSNTGLGSHRQRQKWVRSITGQDGCFLGCGSGGARLMSARPGKSRRHRVTSSVTK